jgi:hypothetical protein
MDNPMKHRIKELGDAINETLSNSDEIAAVIARIKEDGYEVFLVLEATVGFNKNVPESGHFPHGDALDKLGKEPELELNPNDHRFLRSLRIDVDNAG